MEARITTLRELFQKDVRYLVPPFQRPYVWNQEEQWEPLWEDVRNTAERYLEALAAADGQSATAEAGTRVHFLGAVVAQQRLTSAAEIEARDVIDGQQRLTTLQLLIDAAQQAFEEKKCTPQARRLGRLVLNDDVYIEGESDLAFKIWPTTTDRDAFRQAMRNELPNEEYEESPSYKRMISSGSRSSNGSTSLNPCRRRRRRWNPCLPSCCRWSSSISATMTIPM